MIGAPVGIWWLVYHDGAVWPCEIVGPSSWPAHWHVRPLAPAPDAGVERTEPMWNIYDSDYNRPTFQEAP